MTDSDSSWGGGYDTSGYGTGASYAFTWTRNSNSELITHLDALKTQVENLTTQVENLTTQVKAQNNQIDVLKTQSKKPLPNFYQILNGFNEIPDIDLIMDTIKTQIPNNNKSPMNRNEAEKLDKLKQLILPTYDIYQIIDFFEAMKNSKNLIITHYPHGKTKELNPLFDYIEAKLPRLRKIRQGSI